jgi:small subunit ribosomal protein S8
MTIDPIADMLTRIRNALQTRSKEVRVPYSKMKFEIARILLEEGFINNFRADGDRRRNILIQLKYLDGGKSVIYGLKRVSKSSRRVYVSSDSIPRLLGGLGVHVLSTSRGIMTDREARKEQVGGEVVCAVW